MEPTIKVTDLTPDQRKALAAEIAEADKVEKQKRKENLAAFKALTADYVNKHIDGLVMHHRNTEDLIKALFADFVQIQELKAELYGIKIAKQDSHTSTLEDGSASITIGYNVSIGFDGTESAGVEKIREFLTSLSQGGSNVKKLSKAVNTLLKPSAKTGMLNPVSIIELSKMRDDFNDDGFNEGLDIIINAQQRRQNSMYVSGWKFIEIDGISKKLDFRFTI